MFYFTQPLPPSFTLQSIRSVLLSLLPADRWKSSKIKKGSPWLWPLWVWHLQTVWNSQLLKLFEFSPWLDLSNRFNLLNSHFSKSVWIFRCRVFMGKTKLYFCLPPTRTAGTVLTSWLWRSPLSNCSRRESPDFRCSDPSVCSGEDADEQMRGNSILWRIVAIFREPSAFPDYKLATNIHQHNRHINKSTQSSSSPGCSSWRSHGSRWTTSWPSWWTLWAPSPTSPSSSASSSSSSLWWACSSLARTTSGGREEWNMLVKCWFCGNWTKEKSWLLWVFYSKNDTDGGDNGDGDEESIGL